MFGLFEGSSYAIFHKHRKAISFYLVHHSSPIAQTSFFDYLIPVTVYLSLHFLDRRIYIGEKRNTRNMSLPIRLYRLM